MVATATDLFYRDGFRATGVDQIAAAAGVAKRSMYNHFPSKQDLIAEVLRRRHEAWRTSLASALAERAVEPVGKLLAWFDVLDEAIRSPGYRGCIFFIAAIELPDAPPAIRAVIDENNRASYDLLRSLAAAAGAADPNALARELGVLRRGAQVTATVTRDASSVRDAKRAAERILVAHGLIGAATVGMTPAATV